ncbi:alcohol dehydrogenase [Lysinibacillus yapensis]|uniref:Alcohol dehydrogenase n=1 Tax=Ureibacillus yapensis TaxID=2304605 RepID=A0A396S800_9BACL|nr:zinc-binding dehydrogenase [Lysinibacillus yapensis]RHW34014.1 alcohol dehydrogenase [Lysinibacillus yapensis]
MKAWQFTEVNKPLELIEVPEPTPGKDEVKIKVKASGLCHSDVGVIEGVTTPSLGKIPMILGHEIAGVITELGEGVTDFEVGDRVAVRAGADAPGSATDGGYAEFAVSPSKFVVKIPDNVDFISAASATDGGMTSFHALSVTGQVKEGDKVAIVGLGGLGLYGAQIALGLGATVYGVDIKEESRKAAEQFGVKNCVKDVRELADEDIDVVVDFAGFEATLSGSIEAVRPGGRVVLIGLGASEGKINIFKFVTKSLTMASSIGGTTDDLKAVLELIGNGDVKPLLHQIKFDEISEGLQQLADNKVTGRLVAVIDN